MAEDVNSHPPEEHRPSEGADTLGGILAAARREHGLTVEQMAAELRVESRLMEALEEDRFELLPAPVFVKGYLRHLASRFGLEYDDLLHRYAVQTDAEDAPVTYSEPIPEDNKLLVPVIVGALVLIVGIPALWFTWASRDTLSNIASSDDEAPESPPAQVESVPEAAAPFPDPGVAIEPAAPPPAIGLDTLLPPSTENAPGVETSPDDTPATGSDPADAPAAGDESAGAPAAVDEPAVENDAVDPTLPGGQQPVGAAPAVEPPPSEPAAAEPGAAEAGIAAVADTLATGQPTGPLVQVALSYAEDSWTEVNDGNGNSLYYDLGRAGTTATVEGVLPLSFVLGNFTVVQLSINDQPWPIPEPQGNGTTVRFVVNEAP